MDVGYGQFPTYEGIGKSYFYPVPDDVRIQYTYPRTRKYLKKQIPGMPIATGEGIGSSL